MPSKLDKCKRCNKEYDKHKDDFIHYRDNSNRNQIYSTCIDCYEYALCIHCGKTLHYSNFKLIRNSQFYRSKTCNNCCNCPRDNKPLSSDQTIKRKEYKAEYYKKNKESINKKNRDRPKLPKNTIRSYYYKSKYGISLEEYNAILEGQNGVCAICKTKPEDCKVHKMLYVDHCHKSNKIRGLLCFSCNTALGHLNDDIEVLQNAINYLEDDN